MPELPEVTVFGYHLSQLMGCPFQADTPIEPIGINVRWTTPIELVRIQPLGSSHILDSLQPLNRIQGKLEHVQQRGKLLILTWSPPTTQMYIHFGMTGGLTLEQDQHCRVAFEFNDHRVLYFRDLRKWGRMGFDVGQRLKGVGPNVFHMTAEQLLQKAQRRPKCTLRDLLLDQSVTAGVGNYILNETLWHLKLHPDLPCHCLNKEQCLNLLTQLRNIMLQSIAAQGATISNYTTMVDGEGQYSFEFKVYQQQLCPTCATKIVRLDYDGAGNYICPKCQLLPVEASVLT